MMLPETHFGKQLAKLLVLKEDSGVSGKMPDPNDKTPSGSPIYENGMTLIAVIIVKKIFSTVMTHNFIIVQYFINFRI